MTTVFEAAVLRFAPDEGSGEALNVGLAMRTRDGGVRVELAESWRRVTDAFPEAHAPTIRATFARVKSALEKFDREAVLPGYTCLDAELRRLVPSPDGFMKWSEPIEGETDDAAGTFRRLMHRYVEQNQHPKPQRVSRRDEDVKATFDRALEKRTKLKAHVQPRTLVSSEVPNYAVTVQHAWKNGRWNCVQPVSLDLLNVREIHSKAAGVVGGLQFVTPSTQDAHMVLLVGVPPHDRPAEREAAEQVVQSMRQKMVAEADVYFEEDSERLLDRIEADVAGHAAIH